MDKHLMLLSVPGLRERDLTRMPRLGKLTAAGDSAGLVPSFPAVTCPVQANMTTGVLPSEHGVVANGFYWRERHEIEMWTA
ncbi:MAG: alkaline phosphatase family protein, partial [Planctomycetales bacterium]|nr:alkaline phosphatase family protein [Planctomycetales bacterium]